MAEAPASAAPTAHETPARTRRRWLLFGGVATTVVVLDQLTKAWVDSSFELASRSIPAGQPGGPTEIIGEYVRIAKTYNDGAIFGFLDASAMLMAVLSVIVIVGVVWYEWRHGTELGPLVTIGLGLLTGGAVGNLIDRVRFGHVVDFVDMGIGDTRWYAWNIADASVFIAILLLFAAALLGDRVPRARTVPPA